MNYEFTHPFNNSIKIDEFTYAVNNAVLSSKTITTYKYVYNRIIRLLDDDKKSANILAHTEKQIIKEIKGFDIDSAMSKNTMVAVVLLLRRSVDKSTSELEEYSKSLIETHYKNKLKSNETLQDNLPSIKELEQFTNELYEEEKYVDFIINYILLNYNTRNMDLDLKLLADKKDADKNGNYIYNTNKYLMYVRNSYKTNRQYGTKKIKIYNVNVRRAFKILLGEQEQHTLITTTNLNKYIQERTYDGMGETLVLKAILMEYKMDNDISGFERVSKNRGTSIDTLLTSYSIDKKNH